MLVDTAAVGADGVPGRAGEARGAFAARRAESFTQFDPFHFKISPEVAEVIITSPTSSVKNSRSMTLSACLPA